MLILDDSIKEKPYTNENELVNWHYSHTKHRCLKGINLVSCFMRYDDTAFTVVLIAKVFKNEDDSKGTLYLVTNDIESSAEQIYNVYKKRWRIEEYLKSIKQRARLEKTLTKVERSKSNHIFASIVSC